MVSHIPGGASPRAGGAADAPALPALLRQHQAELTEQAGKACLVGLWSDIKRGLQFFRHVNLVCSMMGNEKEFCVPGLSSAGPSWNSGPPNLANPLMDLLLLPLETFDTKSAEVKSRSVEGNQGGFFFFFFV